MADELSERQKMAAVANFMTGGDLTTASKQAGIITSALNTMSFNPDACAKAMGGQHKTLQQTFTRLCQAWFNQLAFDEELQRCCDDRNVASIVMAKDLIAKNGGEPLSYPLPFI